MKKKVLAVVAAAAALALSACVLAGCSSSSSSASASASASASGSASAATKFVVGFDAEYPPYGYMGDDGKPVGFDLDLATEVATRNGWAIELQAIDWDAKDALVDSGAITCIWNGFTMEGREDSYAFSKPYMNNSQVIMVKKGSPIKTEADLAGKTVLTQTGSAADELLNDAEEGKADLAATFAGGKVNTIADYTNAVMQLESGAVDALACDSSIADYFMAQKADVYEVAMVLSGEHYAVGFKKGNQAMADTVTATLQAMVKDGTVAKILDKWAPEGINKDAWCLE